MDMWYSADRKIILYPCDNNASLNFVCIHPAALSTAHGTYNTSANKEHLLEIYRDFDPIVLAFLRHADEPWLKVYPLLDMDTLPTFVKGRLALVGDAAHPFLPHLAQGGAQAIEDGVSLGVLLDRTVSPGEVPQRLELYNEARYNRSTTIQGYTRVVGGDGVGSNDRGGKELARKRLARYSPKSELTKLQSIITLSTPSVTMSSMLLCNGCANTNGPRALLDPGVNQRYSALCLGLVSSSTAPLEEI